MATHYPAPVFDAPQARQICGTVPASRLDQRSTGERAVKLSAPGRPQGGAKARATRELTFVGSITLDSPP